MRVLFQKRLGCQDEAWCADPALQSCVFEEFLLKRMKSLRPRYCLDGGYRPILNLNAEHQAGIHKFAVKNNVARAAVAIVAAFLAAREAQFIAQDFQQTLARLAEELGICAVNLGLNVRFLGHELILLSSRNCVAQSSLG
jgi:hypothetical protein